MMAAMGRIGLKWLAFAVAFVLLLSAINYGLGFVPFTPQWSAKRAAASADRLAGQVDTLQREATGQAEIATATDTYHTETVIIREATAAAIAEARSAPDADTPLSLERANRLRSADDRLCNQVGPAYCAADPAGRGAPAVQPADPSR